METSIANGANGSKNNIREYTIGGTPTTEVTAPLEQVVNGEPQYDEVVDLITEEGMDPREVFDRILALQMRSQVQSLLTAYCDECNVQAGILEESLSYSTSLKKPKKTRIIPVYAHEETEKYHKLHETVDTLVNVIRESSLAVHPNVEDALEEGETNEPEGQSEPTQTCPLDYTKFFSDTLDPNQRDLIDRLLRQAAAQNLVEYLEDAGYSFNLRRETWGEVLDDPGIKKHIGETKDRLSKEFLLLAILYTVQLHRNQAPLIESVLLGKTAIPGELHQKLVSGKIGIYPEMQFALDDLREEHREETEAHVKALNELDGIFRTRYAERTDSIHLPAAAEMVLEWRLPCTHDVQVYNHLRHYYEYLSGKPNDEVNDEDVLLWLDTNLRLQDDDWSEFVHQLSENILFQDQEYLLDNLELSRHVHYLAEHLTRLFTKNGGSRLLTANILSRPDIVVVEHDTEQISEEVRTSIRLARSRKAPNGETRRGVFVSGNDYLEKTLSWDTQKFRPWQRARTVYLEGSADGLPDQELSYSTAMDALLAVAGLYTRCNGSEDLLKTVTYEDISKAANGRVSRAQWQAIWNNILLPELTHCLPVTCIPKQGQEPQESISEWARTKQNEQEALTEVLADELAQAENLLAELHRQHEHIRRELEAMNISTQETPPPIAEDEYQGASHDMNPPTYDDWKRSLSTEQQKVIMEDTRILEEIRSTEERCRPIRRQHGLASERAMYYSTMANQFSNKSFTSLPLLPLLRLSQAAARKMVEEYKSEGCTVHEGYRVRFIECKIPRPYPRNIRNILTQARVKEGHRQQMASRIAFGETRQINQSLEEWYRSFLGLNILLKGELIRFSSDIVIVPSWEVDSVKDPGEDNENFMIFRHHIDSGHPFGYYQWMKSLKWELLNAVTRWLEKQKAQAELSSLMEN